MECPICYEAITAETGIVTTSCNHSYHFSCISAWYINQDKGTCPCCRKDMSEKEDFPDVNESVSDEEYEVEFTRTQLQEFIASHGGHLTEQMSDAICEVIGSFTHMELNSLLVGNTGQTLTEDEWNRLLARDEDTEEEEEEQENSMLISLIGNERNIYMNRHEEAAIKIQDAWRMQKAAHSLLMLKN